MSIETTQRKFAILADAAKYDASCASGFSTQTSPEDGPGIDSTTASRTYGSYGNRGTRGWRSVFDALIAAQLPFRPVQITAMTAATSAPLPTGPLRPVAALSMTGREKGACHGRDE